MLKLTLPELYRLSDIERSFVELFNKWKMSSSQDPIEQFRTIPNPQGLDLAYEIKAIDTYLEGKFPNGYTWKTDSWIAWVAKWLRNTKRQVKAEKDNYKKPFYEIMWDHYVQNSKYKTREEPQRTKYEKIWTVLTIGIESRVPSAGSS